MDVPRRWMVHFVGGGATLRHYAIEPMEGDDPPTVRLTREQWEQQHAGYGLTVDGQPLQSIEVNP